MSIAARLSIDPDGVLQSNAPSPGEARKLLLAAGLDREVWVAVLDEPTNHLVLPSVERLEEALAESGGLWWLSATTKSSVRGSPHRR